MDVIYILTIRFSLESLASEKLSSTTLELGCKKSVSVSYAIVFGFTKCGDVCTSTIGKFTVMAAVVHDCRKSLLDGLL